MRTRAVPVTVTPPFTKFNWHRWFAWRPVSIQFRLPEAPHGEQVKCLVYYEWIERRMDAGKWHYRFPEAQ